MDEFYCDRITGRTTGRSNWTRAEKNGSQQGIPRFKLIDIGMFGGPNDGVNRPNIPILSIWPNRLRCTRCLETQRIQFLLVASQR